MSISLQSAMPWQPPPGGGIEDAGERLLLEAGAISKTLSKVYSYLPPGTRLRRNLIAIFERLVEPRGFEPIQLSALQQHVPGAGNYEDFQCLVSSPFLGQVRLISDTAEVVGRMVQRGIPAQNGIAVWMVSREWRAAGGSGGFRHSVEYENLIAYRTGIAEHEPPAEAIELLEQATTSLNLTYSWDVPALNSAGEYSAHNLTVTFDDGERFRIGQVCEFTHAASVRLGLVPGGAKGAASRGRTVCFSLSVNRTLYALARVLASTDSQPWPLAVAPYHVHVVSVASRLPSDARRRIDAAISTLSEQELAVLVDDRPISAGRKLFDSDRFRIPFRLVVGTRDRFGLRAPQRREVEVGPERAASMIMDIFRGLAQ
ncbi:His/Gly/Thr/Pro-type tRNA ligase C-terminal domain-containing protein [Marinobacter sp. P4B1]|uniref:His/Gly/Thr/Pro-type tRNA ligase C-terminal domain-containing protein n=1 Tax=Marinobacter sp. P4B1 TaxID=1119533 RepID=UPI00071C3AC2|nr:His/Gly/Thr/Pro-type tRNA ligase C-terminal domain-containing protein [Marinobacter sp. P4B1]KRW82225.1 hypothetical protein AQ621_11470 [Marinobacter sp. P4B1]